MTTAAQNLLRSFKALSESEKREFAFEILRRSRDFDLPPISDEEHALLADGLFQNLDERETESQKREEDLLWSQFSLAQALRGMENEDGPVYSSDDLKEVWLTEAQCRARELDAGEVKPILAEEVRRKVRALLT